MATNRDSGSLEKERFEHGERTEREVAGATSPTTHDENGAPDHGLTHAEQRKIVHRIDRRLVVMVGLMYCVSLIDRTNMSSAAIAGMREELDLFRDNRYVSLSFEMRGLTHPPVPFL